MKKILILLLAVIMLTSCGKITEKIGDKVKEKAKDSIEKKLEEAGIDTDKLKEEADKLEDAMTEDVSADKDENTTASTETERTTVSSETTVESTESKSEAETTSASETEPAREANNPEEAADLILETIMNMEPPTSYNALLVQENELLGVISKNRVVWSNNRFFDCTYENDQIAMASILDFNEEKKYYWSPLYEPAAGVKESALDMDIELDAIHGFRVTGLYDLPEREDLILAREEMLDGEKVLYIEYGAVDDNDALNRVWFSLEKNFVIRQSVVQKMSGSSDTKIETTWNVIELDLNNEYPEFMKVPND